MVTAMELLIELYYSKVSSSSLTREQLDRQFLSLIGSKGWTVEEIFFSINYASKYFLSEITESVETTLDNNRHELIKYLLIAKVKQAIKETKECEVNYDQRNTVKRADTPQWLRKSFDKHMFE